MIRAWRTLLNIWSAFSVLSKAAPAATTRLPSVCRSSGFGADAPFAGVTTWATLGLSNHHLTQPGGGGLHQELVMHLPYARQPANAAGVLFQVAAELIERGRGLARGEVVGPRGQLFTQSEMTALVAAARCTCPTPSACATPPPRPSY
jgi:hypothetical protein